LSRGPGHSNGLGLDGDSPFALNIHPVEILLTHLPGIDHSGELEHAVGKGRLTVVDVRNDAEIAQAPLIVDAGWISLAE